MYRVVAVQIENGVITTSLHGVTKSQKGVLSRQPVISTFTVKGWFFKKVFLTSGTQENGSGLAFRSKY